MTRSDIHAWQTEVAKIISKLNALGDDMEESAFVNITEYNDLCNAIANLEKVADTLSILEERQTKKWHSMNQSRDWTDGFSNFINNL